MSGSADIAPASIAGGVPALKALVWPLPQLKFMPTGGMTAENAGDYLAVPNVVAVGGSWIASGADVESGNWFAISDNAEKALGVIKG